MTSAACDMCGGTETLPLYGRDRHGQAVHNVICRACGLVYVSQRPSRAELQDLYQSGAFSVAARGSAVPDASKFRSSEAAAARRFDRLRSHIELPPTGRAMEVGCGVGSFLDRLRQEGWEVMGIEPDGAYSRAGHAKFGLEIVDVPYEDVSVPEVDLIASFHVLEHVESPRRFLAKAGADLAQGGILYLEVPCIERPYGGNLDLFFWAAHLYSFSSATLQGFLGQAGFETLHSGYDGDFLWLIAKNTTIVRPPHLPLEDPDLVRSRTLAHAAEYRRSRRRLSTRLRRAAGRLLAPWRSRPRQR